jgi:transcriptional regulator with XRE-family HTH domain
MRLTQFLPNGGHVAVATVGGACASSDMTLAQKIVLLIERTGLTQADIARAAGVHPSRITELKAGKYSPPLPVALRIARVFQVPLEYLADGGQDDVPPPLFTDEEATLIRLYRAYGLSPAAAYRALTEAASPANPGVHPEAGAKAYPVGGQIAEVPGESPPNRKRG